ncbi:somatomedin-B and thrombospondin type-1 domain-containing protein-like isoform X1 [Mytilus galloprovincialis]|uniref:somatomedin-B and thrombospondin type-1 domain-containing protein-like isoform X1 n=1 Tax=Mytilus galloprovincialis TaxID=29158 RepID=UPI003F7B43E0
MWKSLSAVLFCFILSVVLYSSLTDAQTAQRTVNRFQTCRDVNFCCPGRNNTCYAFGPRRDGNVNESKCFCDDNCRAMNDCCIDHESYCEYQRGQDCVLSTWTEWSKCDSQCGKGIQKRKRHVKESAAHGGKPCGHQRQKRVCYNENCEDVQSVEYSARELREVGRILPAEFGIYRTSEVYNPLKGIRKNLPFFTDLKNEVPTVTAYCGTYKITESSSKCTNTTQANHSWANVLKINAEVCAECQPFAMHKHFGMRCKGHGVPGKVTRWRAIDVPHCSGKWELKTIDRACTCNVHQNKDFIFI